ncbi:Crp/Fnr family transcriptional regulator [Massilia agilis]|uniref:Crp/Fnr family transcriptional regulator n=2 Tax=Massilia agilis TaxID=1811226 RepID=A0ABT2DC33_9BURK|nr:Crp/Fnr family transcriptional regulator [Massilia agilis]MCS0808769.1 Crp/Fnr family transcriptional regulator [Massilia agilis]
MLAMLARFEHAFGAPLPEAGRLAAAVRVRALRHREAAFEAGELCSHVFAVRSGILKQVYFGADGSERIKSFAAPGDLFGCPFALTEGGRTSFASISIGSAVVESIDFRLVEALAEQHPAWQAAVGLAFRRLAEIKVVRERDLLMLSPAELYLKFAQERPELAAAVPQKDLAGYLGVTPVGLNRILRRLRDTPAPSPCGQ